MSDEIIAHNSETAKNPPPAFLALWVESLSQVLGQTANSDFPLRSCAEPPTEFAERKETDLLLIVAAAGGLRGEMSLRIPRPVALSLGQLFAGEPKAADVDFKAEHQESVVELLRQVAGQVCTAAKLRWGEVQLRIEPGPVPSWSSAASGWFLSAETTSWQVAIEWQLSAALHALLNSDPGNQAAIVNAAGNSGELSPSANNLDLLMDVELEVMLRFGSRNMLLQEVLDLGAGAVVELDRQIAEPAELLLDGRVIARGEVVVVDGNYGMRVIEVMPSKAAN